MAVATVASRRDFGQALRSRAGLGQPRGRARSWPPGVPEQEQAGSGPALPLHSLLLVAALAAAVANQGAYYRAGQWLVAILLMAAVLVAVRARPWSRHDTRFSPLWASAALAGWVLVRAALGHDLSAAVPALALLAGVVAVVTVSRRSPHPDALASAALAVGALVAFTGWVGVAWRLSPWALESQGLWRAATSLTYANVAAAVLAMLAPLALGRLVERPACPTAAVTTSLLLVGLGATLSRGGVLALAAGVVILSALLGAGPVARAALAPAIGAAVVLAGLVPSMPASSPPRPIPAALALVAGLGLAAGLPLLWGVRRRGRALLAALTVAVVVALGAGTHPRQAMGVVVDTRLTVSSPDRTEALQAGMRVAASHPVLGVGPGRALLSWVGPDGRTFVTEYAHNEYLQVLVELGVVGLALVLALFAGIARELQRGRSAGSSHSRWAGGAAGLVALAVGSAFDFLWHVPAIPLVGALLIGITTPQIRKEEP